MKKPGKRKCAFITCNKPSRAARLCAGHYRQYRLGIELRELRGLHGKGNKTIAIATRIPADDHLKLSGLAKKRKASIYSTVADSIKSYIGRK